MDVRDVIRQDYVTRQLLARRAVLASRRLWRQVDPKAIRATWHSQVGPAAVRMLTQAQAEAASHADRYVDSSLQAQGKSGTVEAHINPYAFAGTASDGRGLASLLELSNVYALQQISQGASPAAGLAVGGRWLAQTVGMQVLDAGRAANSVAITVRRHVTGYIRVCNGAACARCAILAGRWYRYNADFERHVSCQCGQVPADESDPHDLKADPQQMFDRGLITGLSKADTQAIEDGADLSQVVNAHRGMFSAGGRTSEGVTKRGFAGQRMTALGVTGPRLTPEAIYAQAQSRSEAIDLLYRYGYIS